MAGPTSFIPMIEKWCEKIKPKNILEWGPGYSTKMFLDLCPEARIASVEHSEEWANKWKKEIQHKNLSIILIEAPEDDRTDERWNNYTNPLKTSKFDLIFVDGRERVRCLKSALNMVKPNGVVILHDGEREEYREGTRLYDVVEVEHDTICLKKKA